MIPDTLKGCRLWIIEDDEQLQEVWKRAMKVFGLRVRAFLNGEDAIAAAKASAAPALLLCDYYLSGINGEETVQQIWSFFPSLPVVMVTGKQEVADVEKKLRSKGKAKVLRKPVSLKIICKAFSELSEDKR